ncbi:MAG: hypothetical protein U0736_22780 [Gemmataceae bacterium]
MSPLLSTLAAWAVAMIYLIWRMYRESLQHRDKVMRRRVAYMLWVAANRTA